MKKRGSRGVSALIATVLLVLITVSAFFIVSQGYQKLIVEKQEQISTELIKLNCPQDFDFTVDACYSKINMVNEGGKMVEKDATENVICLIVANDLTAISSDMFILLTLQGGAIKKQIYPLFFGDVPSGGSQEGCYSNAMPLDLPALEVEKIRFMPVLEVLEEGKARPTKVTCSEYQDFPVHECKMSEITIFHERGTVGLSQARYAGIKFEGESLESYCTRVCVGYTYDFVSGECRVSP